MDPRLDQPPPISIPPHDAEARALPPAPEWVIRGEVGDIVAGATLASLAAWFLIQARAIPSEGDAIGATTFPNGLAVMLGLAALGLVAAAIWRLARGQHEEDIVIRRPLTVFIGAVLLGAFPAAMERVGYYPVMAVFLAIFLWIADCRRPVVIAGLVVGFLLFTKVVFEMILLTPLP